MKILTLTLSTLIVAGCVSHPKPCQVERLCKAHRAAVLQCLKNEELKPMMMDALKTIADLEQQVGGYQ